MPAKARRLRVPAAFLWVCELTGAARQLSKAIGNSRNQPQIAGFPCTSSRDLPQSPAPSHVFRCAALAENSFPRAGMMLGKPNITRRRLRSANSRLQ